MLRLKTMMLLIPPLMFIVLCAVGNVLRPPGISFDIRELDPGASESAALVDMNGDGLLDIVSGENWYEAPHWQQHHFRDVPFISNYIDDLSTLPLDVNQDGVTDLITSGWFQ